MELLQNLGFTKYESLIINSLIELEIATAVKIIKKSNIPSNKVYQILKELVKKNLVLESNSNPKKYTLNKIDKELKKLIDKKQEELLDLEKNYNKFLEEYSKPELSEEFFILKDTETLLNKIEDTYTNLHSDSIGIIEKWIAKYSTLKIVKENIDKGKEIRLMGKIKKEDLDTIKKWLKIGTKIKHIKTYENTGISIFDDKYTKISIQNNTIKTIWSENEDLAKILKDYLEILWEKGIEITLENINEFEN